MNKKVTSLKGIEKVRVNDFSEYDSEKSSNGGKYGFWRTTPVWKMERGKFPTAQRRSLIFARAVVTLGTT